MSNVLAAPVVELQDLEFESHVVLLGYLAAVYGTRVSARDGNPAPTWGKEYTARPMRFGEAQVTATYATRQIEGKPVLGVDFAVRPHFYRGDDSYSLHFVPFSELENVQWKVRGVRVK